MPETLLRTKLFIPPIRPNLIPRPQLIERLNQGLYLGHKLSLISAPAGFGKTTLVSAWVAACQRPAAWLSLDEGDNDPTRFLTYLVAALHSLALSDVEGILALLQSPQPPPTESILTILLNEISAVADNFVLVLDDYHVIDDQAVDDALTFLLEHLPPQMHLAIATREDPPLPLARLRARGQLTELRVPELRFTHDEAAGFLNQMMGLNLSAEDIGSLEARTEGWIAGLQLAAISMKGHKDAAGFIQSFTGSHHFVLDYLIEEVLDQQSEGVHAFLLQTAVLDRLTDSLCNALTGLDNGQQTLEYLEQNNLFLVPLDNERRWYRYHHLFAGFLRQRLHQQQPDNVAKLHIRASVWYEKNGLEIEAFQYAAAGNDIERAERLIEGGGMPLHYRGAMAPVLHWLASLPETELDARPSLWVIYASALTMTGQPGSIIEEKLQAAEAALQGAELNDKARDLLGHIAAIRAMLAVPQNEVEIMIAQSRRALEFLHPDNLPVRTTTMWTLGYAYQIQGDRAEAGRAYSEAISISQASGNIMITMAAATCLGQVQESENQLYLAADSYRRIIQLVGDPPWPGACEAYLGLARVCYQWNDLDAAQQHEQQSAHLAKQLENVDTPAAGGVFLARLKLAQGDVAGAADTLAQADKFVRRYNHVHWMPEIAAAQVLTLLHQGNLMAAAALVETHDLPLSQARVYLAQDDPDAALAVLAPLRQEVEAKGWPDERLKVMVLQALAHQAQGDKDTAVQTLGDALALAEPGGFIRIFVDEGLPMAHLLSAVAAQGMMPDYVDKLLAVFATEEQKIEDKSLLSPLPASQPLIDPLSKRELEILILIAAGLKNKEIAAELVISLNTVLYHVKNIYSKLGVNKRALAIAKAKELELI